MLICGTTYYAVVSLNAFSCGSNSLYTRHKVYQQGIDKFSQEIDIIYYVYSLRKLKTLVSSLMDDSEKYLSVYQYQNCLRLIDCSKCQENQPEELQIPKLVSNNKEINSYHQEVVSFFRSYLEEKFTTKDYRVLKGVFCVDDLK